MIERRTFLGTLAAAAGCFLWPFGRGERKREAGRKSARWEWEVGEWEYKWYGVLPGQPRYRTGRREWRAKTTILTKEIVPIYLEATGKVNEAEFCGVTPLHVMIVSSQITFLNDGLAECVVMLRESLTPLGQVAVYELGQPMRTISRAEVCNFQDVLSGTHAIVSIGGREVG